MRRVAEQRAATGGVHEREIARRELAVVRFVPARGEPAVCPDAGGHAAQEGIELCAAYRDLPRHRPHHLQQERIQSDLCTARIREVKEGEKEEEEEEEEEGEKGEGKEEEEEEEKEEEKEEKEEKEEEDLGMIWNSFSGHFWDWLAKWSQMRFGRHQGHFH